MLSVAYSPDGRHIISGSSDMTIRIWDAETGVAVGSPLQGHTGFVWSVTYSPGGRHIISGSSDKTIRIWDADTGAEVGRPLEGDSVGVMSVAYSPDVQHTAPGSDHNTTCVSEPSLHEPSSCKLVNSQFCSWPDSEGWVRDSDGGLLYWVPLDSHAGLHSPALITIPFTSNVRSVSLDFEDFAFATAWTEIYNSA